MLVPSGWSSIGGFLKKQGTGLVPLILGRRLRIGVSSLQLPCGSRQAGTPHNKDTRILYQEYNIPRVIALGSLLLDTSVKERTWLSDFSSFSWNLCNGTKNKVTDREFSDIWPKYEEIRAQVREIFSCFLSGIFCFCSGGYARCFLVCSVCILLGGHLVSVFLRECLLRKAFYSGVR